MGLDMYLSKKTYCKDFSKPLNAPDGGISDTAKDAVNVVIARTQIDHIDVKRVTYIIEEVIYWRKSNQIHKWFVDNCQEGNDDCRAAYVSTEKLEELLQTCEDVLNDRDQAPILLPTQAGFFYGDTNYDDEYFDDVKETRDELQKLLKEHPKDSLSNVSFEYQSSW